MISKKKLSLGQRLALRTIDAAEDLTRFMPAILGLGAITLTAVFIQKEINRKTEINCPKEISVIIEHPTAMGPSYQCVSRVQLHGPAPTFKP